MGGGAFTCSYCSKETTRPTGEVNRAIRKGAPLYCDKHCAGLGRRKWKSDEEKKLEKREYDKRHRAKNRERLLAQKKDYHRRTYDPVAAAKYRKKRMHKHVEYCRRPEYRAIKAKYDRQYRAKREYGELAEHFLLVQEIDDVVKARASRYELDLQNEKLCKSQKRKRRYAKTYSKKLEAGSLGDIKRGQRR